MLARKKLIPLKSEFDRIRTSGKMYDSPSFGLIVEFSGKEKMDSAQAAFIVSKKISRSSVVRHSVKRKLADAVSGFLPRVSKKVELVFLAKQKGIEIEPQELSLEMETCLKRAQLL